VFDPDAMSTGEQFLGGDHAVRLGAPHRLRLGGPGRLIYMYGSHQDLK
jgi:hypothetical protein